MKFKCLGDAAGFKSGGSYEALGFGETAVMMQNDDGKLVSVGYSDLNNDELWAIENKKDKKNDPVKDPVT